MANVLNRATKQYLRSVHEPDYPVQDWIINPDLSAVSSLPTKYWLISGDDVYLMFQAERDAVDAAEREANRDGVMGTFSDFESAFRVFALIVIDEVNARSTKENEILNAMRNGTSLADIKARATAISDSRFPDPHTATTHNSDA